MFKHLYCPHCGEEFDIEIELPVSNDSILYFYIYRNMGMTSNGSFTKDKSRWITFTINEVNRIGNNKPYSATKKGAFVSVLKFN